MVQAQQDFAQTIDTRPSKVLFDTLPINEGEYILTHAAIGIPTGGSGLYDCSYVVNANIQGSGTVGGNLTAFIMHADSSGAAVPVPESMSYVAINSNSPNATLHVNCQRVLNDGDTLKVFVGYVGTGTASTIPNQSILTLHRL